MHDSPWAHDLCCMTPSVLLSTSLALAILAPTFLPAGTATADTSRVAFAVSTSRSSALRPQQAHDARSAFYVFPAATSSHSLGPRRRLTPSQLLLPRSTHHGARRSSQQCAGQTERAESITMVSRGMRRRLFSVLGAARTSFGAATASDASGDGAKLQTAWRRGGGDAADSSVDRTAPSEVQRALNVREQIVQMLRPELPRISFAVLWAVVGTAAALSVPLAYASVVTAILDPVAPPSRLTRGILLLGAGYATEPMATYFYVRSMSVVIDRAASALKVQAFRSLLAQEVAFFDLAGSAELSAAVTTDVMAAKATVQGNLQRDRGLRAVLETVGGLCVLVKLSPRLAWIFGLVIPMAAWGLAEARKRLSALGLEEEKSLTVEAAIASEAVRNIREVRGFGAEALELGRFQASSQAASSTSAKMGAATGRLEALNRAAIYVSILAVMLVGGRLVMAGSMPAPLLLSFIGFCFSLNFAMQGVNFTIADAKRGQAALRRVLQVMAPTAGKSATLGMDVIAPRDFEGKITFRKVHFTYPTRPDKPVFAGLDLDLPAGKVTALVGNSGGGKSTIAALLSRFYAPSQGAILIDGVDVNDLDRRWLTQRIALVGQNPALFTGTIAQNIAYGAAASGTRGGEADVGGVPMDQIVEAAQLANAKDFIEEFPDGFSTLVGEGGVQLSGGQRQRVAIARAVLKDARILILDEATSALDAHSEALVQEALGRLTKGRTVLVIAHRLSTVVNADKICVLAQGKVVEEGNHEDLVDRKGAYSSLMSTQVRSFSTIGD